MHRLSHTRTLLYYDGIQLFLAKNQVGTEFVCLLVEQGDREDKYLCVPISEVRRAALLAGESDLRQLYQEPELDELALVKSNNDGTLLGMAADVLSKGDIQEDWLPDVGLFLRIEEPSDSEVIQEARSRQRAIMKYRFSPPEAQTEPKITAEHLSQGIWLVQRLIKHAFRKALSRVTDSVRIDQGLGGSANYELEVLQGFAAGSFVVHMQSVATADLVGYVQTARALDLVDTVVRLSDDPDKTVNMIAQQGGGHFATAYKDLVHFILETHTPIDYEWSMPERATSSRGRITVVQAQPLYDALSQREELGVEEKKLIGSLTKVDTKNRTWRLVAEDDQKEYHGSSKVALAGLVAETQKYEFVCQERLREERGTGRESTELQLIRYRAL